MTTWKALYLHVVPLAPLQIGTESGIGAYETTARVIPGAMLRGAVAQAALAHCTQPAHQYDHAACPARITCPFWQLFNPEIEPLWGFAYPAQSGMAWPLPLTARTCKREPGYPHRAGRGTHGHGVFDGLVGQFVYDLASDPFFPQRALLQPGLGQALAQLPALLSTVCPVCGEPLKPAAGVYAWDPAQGPFYPGHMPVRRAAHVGINRARGVAEDGLLFAQESLEPQATSMDFHARVSVREEDVNALLPYLEEREYYLGRGRSRGHGHVRLWTAAANVGDLGTRVAAFNQAVAGAFAHLQHAEPRLSSTLPGTLFSVTLNSPMILALRGERLGILTPEVLGIPGAVLLRSWARPELVGGWDGAARLPRRTQLAIQTGSVFVYWVPQAPADAQLLDSLTELELVGRGAERARGYGQLTVCAPFHTVNRIDLTQGVEEL